MKISLPFTLFLVILLQCNRATTVFIDLTASPKYEEINGYGKKIVVVEANDWRKDLGRKSESFIGTAVDVNQKKYDLYIKDNAPLTRAITQAVVDQIKMMNFEVDHYDPLLAAPQTKVDEYIKGADADKAVFIDVYNFSTEITLEVATDWDIAIRIEDGDGKKLLESRKKDAVRNERESLPPDQASKKIIPEVLQSCLDSLFDEEVMNVLLQEPKQEPIDSSLR
jgi:hypothetical protein